MRHLIIITVLLVFSVKFSYSQADAFVISHTGLSNKYIPPIVFSTIDLDRGFSEKYLRVKWQKKMYPPYFPLVVVKNIQELKGIEERVYAILDTINDTAEYNVKFGSFDFFIIENGVEIKRVSINTYELSLRVLIAIRKELYAIDYQNKDEADEYLFSLIQRFTPPNERKKTYQKPSME